MSIAVSSVWQPALAAKITAGQIAIALAELPIGFGMAISRRVPSVIAPDVNGRQA
jgi:hypothetical protein